MQKTKRFTALLLLMISLVCLFSVSASAASRDGYDSLWFYYNRSGCMQTGWQDIGGSRYYLNVNGSVVTGWQKIDGSWYFFNNSGVMQTGWLKNSGNWYYLEDDGAMQTGWMDIGGSRYFFGNSGAMQTGWLENSGDWYFFNSSGEMQTGWITSGGNAFYLMSGGIWAADADYAIVQTALSQAGNTGGEPYWSWYGFDSRVQWCACFVSWCADRCGYIENGTVPKYSGCVYGAWWFRDNGLWADRYTEPVPGMIVFFDWDDADGPAGGQDGLSDHTGIVVKVENGRVYTVEGNSCDCCREKSYPLGYYEIMGYGTPSY